MIGLFDNGICNKHGKKMYPDGRVYIGEFKNDQECGKGIMIAANGEKKSGIWNNGVLYEELVEKVIHYEID
jgi:hypothetical protein